MTSFHAPDQDPTAGTRVFALLGDPVEHSLSPIFQNAALRASGLDGVYIALRCSDRALPALLRGLAEAGGGGNVTLPHKGVAAATVEVPTDAVLQTGACNTFWLEDGQLLGDNTDVDGFRIALRSLAGEPAGARVLLLGAGGAARAAAYALLSDGAETVDILNRTPARADALKAALGDDRRLQVLTPSRTTPQTRYDLIVNATSLGLKLDDPLPYDLERGAHEGAVFDLVYAPGGTAWTRSAAALGLAVADGRDMLLHQGAAAFERWWGQPAPLEAMGAALREAHVAG